MEHGKFSTVAKPLIRLFGTDSLDAVGREIGFCKRMRVVTTSRLVLGLLEVLASGKAHCIADLHRGFNALCGTEVQYKPFHNQLVKPAFAALMRTVLGQAGAHFIVRAGAGINPKVLRATGPDGRTIQGAASHPLKALATKLGKLDHADLWVQFAGKGGAFECRLVVHPNPPEGTLRYLATNLDAEAFTSEDISDAYRLRWQIEPLFKEWKSFASLHRFNTSNPHIAEGLIWAALCAATLKRYCAHRTQQLFQVAVSTQRVAKCIHHVLGKLLHALLHEPRRLLLPEQNRDYLPRVVSGLSRSGLLPSTFTRFTRAG